MKVKWMTTCSILYSARLLSANLAKWMLNRCTRRTSYYQVSHWRQTDHYTTRVGICISSALRPHNISTNNIIAANHFTMIYFVLLQKPFEKAHLSLCYPPKPILEEKICSTILLFVARSGMRYGTCRIMWFTIAEKPPRPIVRKSLALCLS